MTTQLGLFGDDKDVHNKRPRRQLPEDRGQLKLFRDSEVLQFGVNAHPLLPTSEHMKLPMLYELDDKETPEAKTARMQRQAEDRTTPMFNRSWYIVNLTHRVYFQVPFPTQQRAAASPLISGMTAAGHTYLITRDLTGYTPINNHAANDKDQPF